jgi:hypothetical protein
MALTAKKAPASIVSRRAAITRMFNNIESCTPDSHFQRGSESQWRGQRFGCVGHCGRSDGKVLFGASGTLAVDGGLNFDFFDAVAGQFDR